MPLSQSYRKIEFIKTFKIPLEYPTEVTSNWKAAQQSTEAHRMRDRPPHQMAVGR